MKRKILNLIIIVALIVTLLATNYIMLANGIANAYSEELELQSMTTNVKNVEFNAYFMNQEEKSYVKESNLDSEETLILNVNVKEKGVLSDAKIKIENSNFEILKDKVQNTYVKDINLDTNEISLNQIIYQNDVKIEIPIKFKKQETFSEDYFEKENTISISGIYQDEKEQAVSGQIKTKMIYKQATDVNFSEKIEKYIDLGENGVLLQQNITTEVVDNKLPREYEILNLQVPSIDEQLPEGIVVLVNGTKLSEDKVIYNKETKEVSIQNESKGTWGSGNNEYKVIYQYYKDLQFGVKDITLSSKMTTKLYTQDEVIKQEVQTLQINSVGNVVSIEKTATQSVYKGYMYANVSNETTFVENDKIEISEINSIDYIEVKPEGQTFVDGQNNNFDISGKIRYQASYFNKANLTALLGEEGVVTVKDLNDNVLATVNSQTEADEFGKITISYENTVRGVKILTTKPVSEGRLNIYHSKAIEGNTGYTKEQLKTFSKLVSKTKVTTNLSEEIAGAEVLLNDTKTEAKLEINNTNLSTLQTNENVQFLITLKSNTAEYDLFKNPTIQIVLPSGIEKIDVNSINKLYDSDLQIQKNEMVDLADGRKAINMQFIGEESEFKSGVSEGIQIMLNLNITFDKKTPSNIQEVILNYTNENGNEKQYQNSLPIKIVSKYGVMVYSKVEGINNSNGPIETIDDKKIEGQIATNSESKTINIERTILNNYEKDITGVSIIGEIPNIGEENINNETLKSTFISSLNEVNTNLEGAKIYYSENLDTPLVSDDWKESVNNISNVKKYKIVLPEDKLLSSSTMDISYKINIPAELSSNQSFYEKIDVSYLYSGQNVNETYTTYLSTEQVATTTTDSENTNEEQIEGIGKVEITAISGGEEIKEGQEIYEGQTIKYRVKLTNTTSEDLTNVKATITQTNAIFYDKIVTKGFDTRTGSEVDVTNIGENPELKQKEFGLDILKKGESETFEYEVALKEIDNTNETTKGTIIIEADNKEKTTVNTIQNKIKEAKLKISLQSGYIEERKVIENDKYPVILKVKNISDIEQKDIVIETEVPNELRFEEMYWLDTEEYELLENKNGKLKLGLNKIKPGEEIDITISFITEEIQLGENKKEVLLQSRATLGKETYISNGLNKIYYKVSMNIEASLKGDITEKAVKTGDKLIYTATIKNTSSINDAIAITDTVPKVAIVKKAYIIKNGETTNANIQDNIVTTEIPEMPTNEEIQLIIETEIDEKKDENIKELVNFVIISGVNNYIETNSVVYTLKNNSENNITDENNNNNNQNQNNEDNKYNVSGIAWVDKNSDGEKQPSENRISNMNVKIIDSKTGNIVKDTNGNEIKTKTNDKGEYQFSSISQGEYIVMFEYDTTKYSPTEYRKNGISEALNSDVIKKEFNGSIVAMTDNIKVSGNDVENIDAGFTENKVFDLRLDKSISKIIVQNKTGTKVLTYNKEKLAKVEIDAKKIAGTTVLIEYTIDVTNEGEIAGYANEIVDYIPKDLSFSSEINKNWYSSTDGNIYNTQLSKELINPGETKTITLTLTKNITMDNTGNIINTAEIQRQSNDLLIADKDSTPGNKVKDEDDISTAEVLVSIKTGIGFVISSVIILAILAVIVIYLYMTKRKEEKSEG